MKYSYIVKYSDTYIYMAYPDHFLVYQFFDSDIYIYDIYMYTYYTWYIYIFQYGRPLRGANLRLGLGPGGRGVLAWGFGANSW